MNDRICLKQLFFNSFKKSDLWDVNLELWEIKSELWDKMSQLLIIFFFTHSMVGQTKKLQHVISLWQSRVPISNDPSSPNVVQNIRYLNYWMKTYNTNNNNKTKLTKTHSSPVVQSTETKNKFVSYDSYELGRNPGMASCISCQQQVLTNVTHKVGVYAWLMCLLIILCG